MATTNGISQETRLRIINFVLMFIGIVIAATVMLLYFVNFNLFTVLLSLYLALFSVYFVTYLGLNRTALKNDFRFNISLNVAIYNIILAIIMIAMALAFYNDKFSMIFVRNIKTY